MQYEASSFVDSIDIGKHVVFFYEKLDYAFMIQFQFMKNGLLRGQHCIYAMHGDTKFIEDQMAYSGIHVEEFKRKDLLHFYQIPNVMDDPEGALKGAEKIMNKILADSKPPFRVVSVFVPKINSDEQMAVGLDIERNRHSSLSNLQCSWLCPYDLGNIEDERKELFMDRVMQNHHSVIVSSKNGLGIAFDVPKAPPEIKDP
jgi:hypothetical protein